MSSDDENDTGELMVIESDVYEFLPSLSADDLEEAYSKLSLTCPETWKGKKNILRRGMNKHLVEIGDTDNERLPVFRILHKLCTEKLESKNSKIGETDLKENLFETAVGGAGSTEKSPLENIYEFMNKMSTDFEKKRLQEKLSEMEKSKSESRRAGEALVERVPVVRPAIFKISGTIGGSKSLSFEDLNFQIKNACKQGYSDQQVVGAVIRAISPDADDLRTLFELRADNLEVGVMMEFLEPILKEKDSATYFNELCNAVQSGTQTVMDFVVMLLSLKEKILARSKKEGTPFEENMLMNQLMKTLYSGIRNTNIRSEIRENCRGILDISPPKLIKIVGDAMAIENTRNEKFSGKKAASNILNLEAELNSKSSGKNKENYLPVQVQELKVAHETQIAGIRADMDELKTLLTATVNIISQNNTQQQSQNVAQTHNNWIPRLNVNAQQFLPSHQNNFQNTENTIRPGPHHNRNNRNGRNRGRCDECVQNNVLRCPHCFVCKGEGHKSNECPVRNENGNGSGNG